jgi:protein O-mannosyl-transferase
MTRAKTLAKTRAQARKGAQPRTHRGGPFLSGKKLNAFLCALLAGATIALYVPVIGHPFAIRDDRDYVTANPHVHEGLAWNTVKWAFTSTDASNWHPLTWLSHALDYQLFALNPAGHHFDSVLIHALNATFLFLLLAWITKRVGPSLLVAALFAVHPLNVESVAWVAERKNVLSTFFFICAIGSYVWYAQKPGWRRYLLVAVLFAVGLMAKPMVITLPFVLLLLDYWPLERMQLDGSGSDSNTSAGGQQIPFSTLVLEKLPLIALSAASAWITLKAQQQAVGTLLQYPLAVRIGNAIVSYGLYLWKMLWPARLALLYPYPAVALPAWQWALSALVLLSITGFVVAFRRKRYLSVGWFWFLGTLVPVIGLVQVGDASMADRYAYVPLVGIFVMIAWGLDDWAEAKRLSTVWRVVPAVCVLTALGFVAHRQISYWDSDYHLWSHALAVTVRNPVAHGAMAGTLINPESAMTQHELESSGSEQERMEEAQRHHEEALKIYRQLAQQNPDVYLPYVAMLLKDSGNLSRYQNHLDEARQHYEEALEIYHHLPPQNRDTNLYAMAVLLNELGTLDGIQNRWDDQRLHYEEQLRSYRQLAQQKPATYLPYVAKTLNNLGTLDLRQNRADEARDRYEQALQDYRQLAQQDPRKYLRDVAGTLTYLGFVNRSQNRLRESRADYQESLALFQKLLQGDAQYSREVTGVGAILQELDKKTPNASTK